MLEPEHRRDFEPNRINAVVVRKWNNQDYGPGGKTVFLTNAAVAKPLQPFDDYDDRSLIVNCCIKESKQQRSLKHPSPTNCPGGARARPVHFTDVRLGNGVPAAVRARGKRGEPVGWQRGRRQLVEEIRDQAIVFAEGCYGIFHMAEYSLLLGVTIKDRPPGIGTHEQVLGKYRLTTQR